MRVRTGYETAISHLCGSPFTSIADADGVVLDVNDDLKIIKVQYKDGSVKDYSFDKEFSNNSGNGFYVPQNIELNNFKKGDKVKRGDVLTYNKDYFYNNDDNKQVDMKLGIPARIAWIDVAGNAADGSVISSSFAKKLDIGVAQVVTLIISKDSNIYDCVKVGQKVTSTDTLMTYDDSPITVSDTDKYDESFVDILNSVNKTKTKAGYTGVIADIHPYYKCEISDMSPTVASKVKEWINIKNKKHKYTKDVDKFPESKPLRSDKVGTILLTTDIVVVRITIEQNLETADGDKIFVASSNKSIIADIAADPILTESGLEVDVLHGGSGIDARIVNSPYLVGTASAIAEKIEQDILAIWFDN